MLPYDATLLTAVEATPQSIPDVLRVLRTIDATCIDQDGLKWFNWLYLQVTEAVEARVAGGGFDDPEWLAQLDVQFARLYFTALESALSGHATSSCWHVLFRARQRPEIARIQFALAGINAHINHDLPEAIVATCQVTGTAPDRTGNHYADYTALNATLSGIVDTAKNTLKVRLPGDAIPAVTRLEDTIAAWSVSAARESAWKNAEHLWEVRRIPALAAGFMEMLDGFTTVIGKTLVVPV